MEEHMRAFIRSFAVLASVAAAVFLSAQSTSHAADRLRPDDSQRLRGPAGAAEIRPDLINRLPVNEVVGHRA